MSAVDLLVGIIKEHAPEDIWQGSPLIGDMMPIDELPGMLQTTLEITGSDGG